MMSISRILGTSFPGLSATATPLLLLKLTILLALAGLLATLLRGRTAATRHVVWLAALAGALVLPLLVATAPRLPVGVPAAAGRAVPRLVLVAPAEPVVTGSPALVQTDPATTTETAAAPRAAWRAVDVLALLWVTGFLGVTLWSVLGHLGLWGLHRSSLPVERQAWARHYGMEPPAGGAAARVRLALSSVVGTPLTWGWLRPIVLLPSRSSAWPLERRRAALLHELAHVGRGDYLAQLLATLACAVYWFHPLVWWAAARLRSESEHACDDRVLAAGTPAPSYASDLLAVAHAARGPGGSSLVAIGMARPSHLEGRLLAVLDEKRPRGSVRTRAGLAVFAATLLALVPFAGLEPHLVTANAASASSRR